MIVAKAKKEKISIRMRTAQFMCFRLAGEVGLLYAFSTGNHTVPAEES